MSRCLVSLSKDNRTIVMDSLAYKCFDDNVVERLWGSKRQHIKHLELEKIKSNLSSKQEFGDDSLLDCTPILFPSLCLHKKSFGKKFLKHFIMKK